MLPKQLLVLIVNSVERQDIYNIVLVGVLEIIYHFILLSPFIGFFYLLDKK